MHDAEKLKRIAEAREHYFGRKVSRDVQVWLAADGSFAKSKGEAGAVPIKRG